MGGVLGLLLLAASLLLSPASAAGEWLQAHATFYGNNDPGERRTGACGYDDVFKQGYGNMTAALSTALYNSGAACGGCYEIECADGATFPGTVTVTATNFCPPADKPNDDGGWCNPPLKHFDLNFPAFLRIAKYRAGIAPVKYRRVPCQKSGGFKLEMRGNKDWIAVLVFNVGGAGDVAAVSVKGEAGGWVPMERSSGDIWDVRYESALVGQKLSFRVTTGDGKSLDSDGVVPADGSSGRRTRETSFRSVDVPCL